MPSFEIIFLYTLIFFLGASIGSFIGVLIDRVPRKESIVKPSSHCTNCGHNLSWYENIPLISYIALGGRCHVCRSKIPLRFFFLELSTGILLLIILHTLISTI